LDAALSGKADAVSSEDAAAALFSVWLKMSY